MSAVIVPFETRAQREERLYRACEAAYFAHMAEPTWVSRGALVQAHQRWTAAQTRAVPSGPAQVVVWPATAA